MNYFKSALAGFGMSFIGTSLCGAKTSMCVKNQKKDYWCGDENWTFPKAFLSNNIACIPTAMLGAAYHDYFGKDVAQKFNDYFKTDVSPYILDGAVFGSLVLFCGIPMIASEKEIDKTFILSTFIIQGFVLGYTAAFGAYFGDEEVSQQNEELDVTPLDPC